MDSFLKTIKSATSTTTTDGGEKTANPDQPSSTELLSSAKLVAEAAQSAASNQTEKIDKAKVAGAAADLLDATKQYGKFDETQGVGQYIKKADDYLHEYEKSGATPAPASVKAGGAEAPAPVPTTEPEKKEEEKKEESGGGFGAGDAVKAAGSFFK